MIVHEGIMPGVIATSTGLRTSRTGHARIVLALQNSLKVEGIGAGVCLNDLDWLTQHAMVFQFQQIRVLLREFSTQ